MCFRVLHYIHLLRIVVGIAVDEFVERVDAGAVGFGGDDE
jgi:hypothetical protein